MAFRTCTWIFAIAADSLQHRQPDRSAASPSSAIDLRGGVLDYLSRQRFIPQQVVSQAEGLILPAGYSLPMRYFVESGYPSGDVSEVFAQKSDILTAPSPARR
ncbi:MAG: hypothetical protein PHQ40_17655 [Anaerolineaceae bacterium]|nr:hypothetical protein [Anaerolineaceae bacterium]